MSDELTIDDGATTTTSPTGPRPVSGSAWPWC